MKLSDWPSLRLVIPFIAGIFISDTIENTPLQVPVWCALAVIGILITLMIKTGDRKPRISGFFLSLSFMFAGMASFRNRMEQVKVEWPGGYAIYHGTLTSYPVERERTYRLDIKLRDSLYLGRNIYMYVPKDSAVQQLEPGMIIVFDGKVNKPSSEGAGFDYESYLLSHGISGTLRVQAKDWHALPPDGTEGVRVRAVLFRRNIIRKYQEWGLQDNALAVASAVSLGEKRALSDGLREIYSTSGVSHVLAVSGLHVGIMCWFLYLIFPSFLFRRREWMRELLVIGIMWVYAFVIGFPVSMTRALIMFSIIAVCRSVDRESSALNSLGVSALLMLAANPSALFDMSFQLSFSAVLFIVILTPPLVESYKPANPLVRYVWRVSALSLSAQIGTAPLIMYHFSVFSTYVLLANLFVVPAMFVIVALSMSLWIIGWIPLLRGLAVSFLTWMVNLLTAFLTRVAALPYSNIELSIRNGWNVLVIYAVVIFVFLWLKEGRTHRIVQALAGIALASILGVLQNFVV